MKPNLVDVILAHQDIIESDDLIGVRLKHRYYGRGHVTGYCPDCHLLTTEYRGGETIVIENLNDVLGDLYGDVTVRTKQLERRLGYLWELVSIR
jgi:hypothetical protein